MKNLETQQLVNNTRLLKSLYNSSSSYVQKMDILDQINLNLQVLKISLPKEEYEEQFRRLEDSANKILENLTNPSFIKNLVGKLANLINTF